MVAEDISGAADEEFEEVEAAQAEDKVNKAEDKLNQAQATITEDKLN